MQQDDKNPVDTDASSPTETTQPTVSRYRNPVAATLLFLSGIGLWGSAAAGGIAIFFGGSGFAAINQLATVFMFAAPAAAGGVVLLALYAVIQQPWHAGRGSIAFALQVPFALLVLLGIGAFELDARRSAARQVRGTQHEARIAADEDVMKRAIANDDATSFSPAYADCGESCRDPWMHRAILANAPRILAVTLKGVTRETYSQIDKYYVPMICKDGVLYQSSNSLARFVGFRNSPAVTALFAPLWGPEDRDHAFLGATMGGSTKLMDTLVKQGVNPRALHVDVAGDDAYASAAAGAAAGSVRWLVEAGVKVQTADSVRNMWRSLAEWADYAPPELAAKGAEEWLAESSRIPFAPDAKLDAVEELKTVVQFESPVLVAAMLQHGYRTEDLDADYQERLKNASPPDELATQNDRKLYCDTRDWKFARGKS
ncbi:hypothetical protein [Paraburkholderia flava]|uniref:hypothetical protein n=1 Tax=Paraburkholderia flava TaxID=2547393 RepID=UPI00105EBFCE|nr:hypothetical protein [Paraburkholderia flava]